METLIHFVDWLLAATARASLLTLLVLGAQVLLRHRVPARWLYSLWLPVLVVLLTPAFPESQWSVGSIVRTEPAPLPVPVMVAQDSALDVTPSAVEAAETPAPNSWIRFMRLAWVLGAAGMIVICLGSYALTLWRIKRSRVPVSDALLSHVAALAWEIGLRRAPQVWMASAIPSPAVTGFLRPTLLLPAQFHEALTAQEMRLVLRHELTHLKRGDLPLNALLCLLLALHWFNPLLWLAFFKVRLDREAACDAQVLDREQQPGRVAYGHTLLKVESTFSHHGFSLGFVGIFQRGIALRSRIQSIATQPNPHPFMKITLSLGIVLLTFLGITKAVPPDTNAPQVMIEAKFVEFDEDAKDLLTSLSPDGVLNEDQLGNLWKKIEAAKGVDVLGTPQVTTRSGEEANISIVPIVREDADGKPTTKILGITLTLLPGVTGENDIELELSPQIMAFEGMVKDPNSGLEQPVFNERKMTSRVKMISGQTVVLEMPPTATTQATEDRSAGGVTTKTENVARHTRVFVTARLMDPAGNPDEARPAPGKSPLEAKLEAIILPEVHFHEASLTDAVEFLRIRTRELDPAKKGLNLLVKPGGDPKAKITLRLNDVPAFTALRYIAELSGHTLSVEGDVLVIAPAGAVR